MQLCIQLQFCLSVNVHFLSPSDCEMNIHKSCAKQVEEVCIGQLHKKDRSRDTRFGAILGKIISDDKETKRKFSHISAAHSKCSSFLNRCSVMGMRGLFSQSFNVFI